MWAYIALHTDSDRVSEELITNTVTAQLTFLRYKKREHPIKLETCEAAVPLEACYQDLMIESNQA